MISLRVLATDACRNCRRPIELVDGVGWLHGELPRYAAEPITCDNAIPVSNRLHNRRSHL